jgi:MoaA/NifB/PqqE/SkfB family radical SAM enzyme
LAAAVIRAKLLRRVRLRYVDFALDYRCNMRCDHCFATNLTPRGDNPPPKMTLEDYRRVAAQAMDLGAVNFSFQGGEPLLLENLDEYIKAVQPHKNVISVTTNGSLLNREKVLWLKKQGVDILTVSIDSSIAEEHDRFRNFPGAFERAMNGIRAALDNGLHVTIGTTISHDNINSEGITELIEFAEKNKIILCFALATPIGNWAEGEALLLTGEDLAKIRQWEKELQYIRTDFEANLSGYGCGAAKEIIYITPYGDVLSCPFIHIGLGNLHEESLGAIRDRALTVKEFAEFAPKCLCAEDRDFIKRYITPTSASGLADGFKVFNWR